MWLMKTLLTSRCINQRGAGQFIALLVGIVTGLIFSIFKLPIPAPPVLPGIIGIVGVYLGSKGYHVIMQIIS